ALAGALEVSVSELTRLPVPAPANGHTDSTTVAVGVALDGIEAGTPVDQELRGMARRSGLPV
ncbi:MAG: hypothetical protein ACT4NY_20930, partial [Pseudonocardiales bacterium]